MSKTHFHLLKLLSYICHPHGAKEHCGTYYVHVTLVMDVFIFLPYCFSSAGKCKL